MDLLSQSMKGRLLFAIPKKGRLHELCLEVLAGADIQYTRSHRLDVCLVQNHNIALVFLPAADIPRFVGLGNVDLGITGHDVIVEAQMESRVTQLLPLGFGKCRLQVQVPQNGPIKRIEDLAGKRVVTSFDIISGQYFAKQDEVLGLVGDAKTRIEYVGGSVEAACALGLADGIVDLVESGETMRAAGLHAIETILTTEAVLIAGRSSEPSSEAEDVRYRHPEHEQLISMIKSRLAGVVAAKKYILCQYNIQRENLAAGIAITPGRRAPTITQLDGGEWMAVSAMVLKKEAAEVMDRLVKTGAHDVLLIKLENCRV